MLISAVLAGEVLGGVLGLLDHVDRILEPHEREERQGGHRGQGHENTLVLGGFEHHGLAEVRVTLGRGPETDQDHDQQTREFNAGEHHVEFHGLGHATQVDERQDAQEHQVGHRKADGRGDDVRHDQDFQPRQDIAPQLDPFGKIPEFKFCAARLEPASSAAVAAE